MKGDARSLDCSSCGGMFVTERFFEKGSNYPKGPST